MSTTAAAVSWTGPSGRSADASGFSACSCAATSTGTTTTAGTSTTAPTPATPAFRKGQVGSDDRQRKYQYQQTFDHIRYLPESPWLCVNATPA